MDSPSRVARVAALALVATIVVAGCAGWTTQPDLSVRVETTVDRPLLIYVNGAWVGTIPANAGQLTIPSSGHGGPPWRVEARTDSGRVLGALDVASGSPAAMGAALRCGILRMQVGDAAAVAVESPSAAAPACD